MTIWAVQKAYDNNDNIYYHVLPYNLMGTIKIRFLYGWPKTLFSFFMNCRLSKKSANKLKDKKMRKANI